jgi:hypothetical protein
MPDHTDALTTVLDVATSPVLNPDGTDRILTEIAEQARLRKEAEQRLRYLVAYAREFIYPRPYKLVDLARAAGLSISGTRILYADTEVDAIATALHRAHLAVTRTGTASPS